MMGTIADLLRWSTSSGLILTVSVCSLGAAVQGWDQTESNGASESLPNGMVTDDGDSSPRFVVPGSVRHR